MDRKTQAQEIRKLLAAPDFMLGSVQAITVDGILVDVSATGSQIGPYANTAGKVILVVGSQKIVPDLDAAFKRIREYVQPLGRSSGAENHQHGNIRWKNPNHRARVDQRTNDRHTGQRTNRDLEDCSGLCNE